MRSDFDSVVVVDDDSSRFIPWPSSWIDFIILPFFKKWLIVLARTDAIGSV